MGGLAYLAHRAGARVTGSDQGIYPPMSNFLEEHGIPLQKGYAIEHLQPAPDLVLVGNAMSRGNPAVEYMLNEGLPFMSGPAWLYSNVLKDKHVMAVSGTHGKTTTTAILAWILEFNGLNPGFLVGGIPKNFGTCARSADSPYFVIEADEYDTTFFDKRAKFIHYFPQTLLINNIEFDHADIFSGLDEISREFHRLIRVMPSEGKIIAISGDSNVETVMQQGCWTPVIYFGSAEDVDFRLVVKAADYSQFMIQSQQHGEYEVNWGLVGQHNAENATAAVVAGTTIGISLADACASLSQFTGVKRRLECIFKSGDITIYDDFAHHPTAIFSTLSALRKRLAAARIIAVFEPRSNTMKQGVHKNQLAESFKDADQVLLYQSSNVNWQVSIILDSIGERAQVFTDVDMIVKVLVQTLQAEGGEVVIMSNGSFSGLHKKLLIALESC